MAMNIAGQQYFYNPRFGLHGWTGQPCRFLD